MIRHRLRSNNGCIQCRARRKKCDETKPVCQACIRLQLPCWWKNPDSPVPTSVGADVTPATDPPFPSTHPPSLRLPDFIPFRRSDQIELPNLKEFIADASTRDFGVYGHDHDLCSPQDFVIQGVRKGWHTILDHPDAECMTRLDRQIESCGHGQAARIACCWLFHILQTCFRLWRRGEETAFSALPLWYIPLQLQSRTVQVLDTTSFIAWPALRRRMLTQPFPYLTDRFLLELMSDGARFIWPCSYAEIVTIHQETGRYEFSDEFWMRVSNLRSFTLTKDFLDRYPELRGDAAQLEPSVTTYQLSEAHIAETIFWAKLREARHKKNERNTAQAEPPDVEQVEVTITAGEE